MFECSDSPLIQGKSHSAYLHALCKNGQFILVQSEQRSGNIIVVCEKEHNVFTMEMDKEACNLVAVSGHLFFFSFSFFLSWYRG
jgi:hypothetical protein